MGFYLRKAFGFGPLRLNLSRSGLGLSAGVKGFRLGIRPNGQTYIHAGRYGLYYRQNLGHFGQHGTSAPVQRPDAAAQDFAIPTANADNFHSVTAETLVAEINRVTHRMDKAPLVALLTVSASVAAWFVTAVPWYAVIATPIVGIVLTLWARHTDVTHGTLVLEFDDLSDAYKALGEAIKIVGRSERVWRIDTAQIHGDWKRHAGASTSVTRTLAIPYFGQLRRVKTNIDVPIFPAGPQRLYFFPNQVLVSQGASIGAIDYADFRMVDSGFVEFREDETPPKDAECVGKTWRYVNKNGGADRRFINNAEIPIMRYAEFEFRSGAGLHLLYLCSKADSPSKLAEALRLMVPSGY